MDSTIKRLAKSTLEAVSLKLSMDLIKWQVVNFESFCV